jgi:hypothetical protein
MILENKNIVLDIILQGGGYVDFHRKDLPLNPINWESVDPTQPPFKGHFLCFDRWGPLPMVKKQRFFLSWKVNLLRWKYRRNLTKKRILNEVNEMSFAHGRLVM